jgi:hypothetical protein
MMRITNYFHSHRVAQKVAYYALYALSAALALIVGLVIWRQTLLLLVFSLPVNADIARLLSIVSMGVLSIGLISGILASEPYLRSGMEQGTLLRRFLTIALWLGTLGFIGMLIPMALAG